MKKIYSFVLMAAMLLIGANAWAVDVSNTTEFENAWKSATNGTVIRLTNDIELTKPLWLGTTNMNGQSISITLDLNGWVLSNNAAISRMFYLTKGELNVITSRAGGQIIQQNWAGDTQELFRITGSTNNDINPKVAGYFTHLVIGEGVTVDAQKQNALVVDQKADTEVPADALKTAGVTAVPTYTTNYLANGVRVDVYGIIKGVKYAFKVNGNVHKPTTAPDTTAYSPYIYLHGTSDLSVPASNTAEKKPVAVYCSGYARWLIEGHCVGATAVYVKGGEIDINDAVIESNYTGTYVPAAATNSGVTASGSAIVIESNKAYPGSIDVEIGGDTKVSATNGYAIDESVTNASNTKVETITISGGTFEGGQVPDPNDPTQTVTGIMTVSEMTAIAAADPDTITTITIIGGQTNQGQSTIGDQNLADYLATQSASTHITTVTDENGKTTMVISQGSTPDPVTEWTDIEQLAEGTDANWTGFTPGVVGDGNVAKTITLGELQINSGYDATHLQELTIKNKATLKVNHLIMNGYARIIVEAGGKLIVEGEQGMIAPSVHNLVLRTQEGNPSMLLFNPAVTSNRHPKATVEFTSKSITKPGYFSKQRFGIPTFGKLDSITAKYEGANVATGFEFFNYEADAWQTVGFINEPGQTMDYQKMANPFEYYQMQHNSPDLGTVVTMYGQLYGNENPELGVRGNFWNGFANSYMAPIDGVTLINLIPNTVDKAFYLYDITANYAKWLPVTLIDEDDMPDIQALQPFLIRNTKAAATATIDYEEAVYNPAMGIVPNNNPAPRRAAMNDMTKARLIVKGENGYDRVTVAESDEFSAEFDNGYDAVKYMNEGINMYVSADEKMSIFATDNLEDTYVGLQTVKGGNYTIEFAKVQGNDLTLIDLETGAQVAMVEGNVYEFTATANTTNDYRFRIVSTRKVMTGMENTEAVKSAKGIYTITGQYVGEMNVWNSLPAGVYVIDGAKCVK